MATLLSSSRVFVFLIALAVADEACARRLGRFPRRRTGIDAADSGNSSFSASNGDVRSKTADGEMVKHMVIERVRFDHYKSSWLKLEDPSNNVFFTPGDLQVNKKLKIFFAKKDPATSPSFLPREQADSIPFSSSKLPSLLKRFSLPEDSSQAAAMEDTLGMCETEPTRGEIKLCATSLESMIDFAVSVFGEGTKLSALTNIPLTKLGKPLQNYTILEQPKEKKASKVIGCHTMPYPYAIYYCHSQEDDDVRVFQILLGGEDGETLLAAGICHMDTSQWDPNHISFRMLKLKPGYGAVCHFIQSDNILWLPASS